LAVVPEAIGFIRTDPVDHLTTVLGDDVEQVIDDFGTRALSANLLLESHAHIHGHSLDAITAFFPEQLEERSDLLAFAPSADPQDLLGTRVDDHGGVAMPPADRELVYGQNIGPAQIHRAELLRQMGLVDGLDTVPRQIEELSHVLDRQHRTHPGHALSEATRHPRITAEPAQLLELRTAPLALNPPPMDQQKRPSIEQRQVADPALGHIVDARNLLLAAPAPRNRSRIRMQLHTPLRPRPTLRWTEPPHRTNSVAFPFPEHGNRLIAGHGSPLPP